MSCRSRWECQKPRMRQRRGTTSSSAISRCRVLGIPLRSFPLVRRLLGKIDVQSEGLVLEQEGAARSLEEDVVAEVAEGELLAGFLVEVIAEVFGFPKAVGEAEVVEQRAVHAERVLAQIG